MATSFVEKQTLRPVDIIVAGLQATLIIYTDREKYMFTLKFCNYYEDGDSSVTTLCCQHYHTYQFKNRVEVTLYKDFTSVEGVTYTVADEDIGKPYWQVCYVENINGKTIDKIRPYHDNRTP